MKGSLDPNSKKRIVGVIFDEIVHETPKAWLLTDEVSDEEAEKEPDREYSYTMYGMRYCKDDAFWFPKSQCKLKHLKEGYELQLPVWLAEKNEIIDDCYGVEQPEEDAFPAGPPGSPEAQREPVPRSEEPPNWTTEEIPGDYDIP
jgi:hypothetical protein